jgi:hypothetical protein
LTALPTHMTVWIVQGNRGSTHTIQDKREAHIRMLPVDRNAILHEVADLFRQVGKGLIEVRGVFPKQASTTYDFQLRCCLSAGGYHHRKDDLSHPSLCISYSDK